MDGLDPDWDLYRSFLAVAEEGSLSAAARRLGLSQPTVGRHIEGLEARLGASLFTRSQRGLQPTQMAADLLPLAREMAAVAAALRRAASGDAQAEGGTVRLTAPEMVGLEILPAVLAAFCHEHPRIALELALSNRNLDLLRRDADIAVRMARPTQKALLARRLGTLDIGLYAHRSYAERFGLPATPADRGAHRLIGFDQDAHAIQSAGGAAAEMTRSWFGFRTDNGAAQMAALRAGVGIGGCAKIIARQDPDLIPVLEAQFTFRREMWLLMHEDSKAIRRVRRLYDHLTDGLTVLLSTAGDLMP